LLTPPSHALLTHLETLTDDVGIVQHAVFDVPNRSTGYCTDDVARAFMVALAAAELDNERDRALRLAGIYLAYLFDAQLPDGRFHNFMGYDRRWLDPAGCDDAFGRALWALGYGLKFAPRDSWRALCATMLARALPHLLELDGLRPRAYAIVGLAHAAEADGVVDSAIREAVAGPAADLVRAYEKNATPGWAWFEDILTYDNARLPEALLWAGRLLGDERLVALGLETLAFYETVVIENGIFVPIGSDGWYPRGGTRARYAQQPLEAAALVDAALVAFNVTGDLRFSALARIGCEWFYGRNTDGALMVSGGGCRDGIDARGVNQNMGAESTLAYLWSALALTSEANNAPAAK
jgi:hypothetical protein